MIGEAVAQLFLEIVCYFTARFLLPLMTFGRVNVDPMSRGTRLKMKWHGVHRTTVGKIVLHPDLGTLLGLIFWLAVVVLGFTIYFHM
jgi:hypothetical protein